MPKFSGERLVAVDGEIAVNRLIGREYVGLFVRATLLLRRLSEIGSVRLATMLGANAVCGIVPALIIEPFTLWTDCAVVAMVAMVAVVAGCGEPCLGCKGCIGREPRVRCRVRVLSFLGQKRIRRRQQAQAGQGWWRGCR